MKRMREFLRGRKREIFKANIVSVNALGKAKVSIAGKEFLVNNLNVKRYSADAGLVVGDGVIVFSGKRLAIEKTVYDLPAGVYPPAPSWWLYPTYEPTSPDYPYLKWMLSNPEKPQAVDNGVPVSTPADLAGMVAGNTYYLVNDIDMSGVDWTPLWVEGDITIEGNGYTISNLTVNRVNPDYRDGAGLLGVVDGVLTVHNLRLKNVSVSVNDWVTAGGLVGMVNNAFDIENVFVSGSVSSAGDAGGVIGGAYSTSNNVTVNIARCVYVDVDISVGNNGGVFAGGLFLVGGAIIERCWANGDVVAPNGINCGGFAGFVASDDGVAEFTKCCYFGSVDGRWNVAGFIATVGSGTGSVDIDNCFARGSVRISGTQFYYAGFLSTYAGANSVDIANCYSAVEMFSASTVDKKAFMVTTNPQLVSGCYYDDELTPYSDDYASPGTRKGFLPAGWDTNVWEVK